MSKSPYRWFAVLALTLSATMAGGCGYTSTSERFVKPYQAGQFDLAAKEVDDIVGPVQDVNGTDPKELIKVDRRDAIVYRLEQGAILRAAGRLKESSLAFLNADDIIYEIDQKPPVQVSREVGAAVTNLSFTDYKGYSYDRLALQIYQSLNYMQLGQLDNARVALRALQERQEDAEEYFRKQIEALEAKNEGKAADGEKQSVDVDKVRQDPKVSQAFATAYGDDAILVPDRSAYRKYANPFGEYLQGVYFMAAALNSSDTETAATAFKRVKGMLPDNPYVIQDLALAEKVANGQAVPPTTYVFFETGQAPLRETIRIDIPIFIINAAAYDTGVDYVGAAFPKLKFRDSFVPYLSVAANGQAYQTAVLTDMDEVIRTDFNNELPMVITKTIIATVAKAAIAYGLNRASEGNVYANLITRIGTTAYQAGLNQADLRSWETLPKQFQVARFDTPADRQLTIALPGGAQLPPITLIDGVVNVVYVKSVQATHTPHVQQFTLK
ncbi:MAG: hypothetical protein WD042_19830 [Phycisphaeraceae bacterium]